MPPKKKKTATETVKQLKERAKSLGIDITGLKLKKDIQDAIDSSQKEPKRKVKVTETTNKTQMEQIQLDDDEKQAKSSTTETKNIKSKQNINVEHIKPVRDPKSGDYSLVGIEIDRKHVAPLLASKSIMMKENGMVADALATAAEKMLTSKDSIMAPLVEAIQTPNKNFGEQVFQWRSKLQEISDQKKDPGMLDFVKGIDTWLLGDAQLPTPKVGMFFAQDKRLSVLVQPRDTIKCKFASTQGDAKWAHTNLRAILKSDPFRIVSMPLDDETDICYDVLELIQEIPEGGAYDTMRVVNPAFTVGFVTTKHFTSNQLEHIDLWHTGYKMFNDQIKTQKLSKEEVEQLVQLGNKVMPFQTVAFEAGLLNPKTKQPYTNEELTALDAGLEQESAEERENTGIQGRIWRGIKNLASPSWWLDKVHRFYRFWSNNPMAAHIALIVGDILRAVLVAVYAYFLVQADPTVLLKTAAKTLVRGMGLRIVAVLARMFYGVSTGLGATLARSLNYYFSWLPFLPGIISAIFDFTLATSKMFIGSNAIQVVMVLWTYWMSGPWAVGFLLASWAGTNLLSRVQPLVGPVMKFIGITSSLASAWEAIDYIFVSSEEYAYLFPSGTFASSKADLLKVDIKTIQFHWSDPSLLTKQLMLVSTYFLCGFAFGSERTTARKVCDVSMKIVRGVLGTAMIARTVVGMGFDLIAALMVKYAGGYEAAQKVYGEWFQWIIDRSWLKVILEGDVGSGMRAQKQVELLRDNKGSETTLKTQIDDIESKGTISEAEFADLETKKELVDVIDKMPKYNDKLVPALVLDFAKEADGKYTLAELSKAKQDIAKAAAALKDDTRQSAESYKEILLMQKSNIESMEPRLIELVDKVKVLVKANDTNGLAELMADNPQGAEGVATLLIGSGIDSGKIMRNLAYDRAGTGGGWWAWATAQHPLAERYNKERFDVDQGGPRM